MPLTYPNAQRGPVQTAVNFHQHDPIEFIQTDIADTSSEEDVLNAFQIFWTTFPGQVGSNSYPG